MAAHETDVVVVGGGPAGIVAGVALAQRGIDALVLEAAPELATDLRASTLHAPTLDYLAAIGLAQDLYPLGLKSPEYRYFNRARGTSIGFDMSELADVSAHPYRLQCEQWKLTGAGAHRLGARLRLGRRVVAAANDGSCVSVTAETDTGPETYRARYAIACDGANSVLRRALDIGFDGFTYEEKFLCLSTTAPVEDHLPGICNVNYMADPAEWLVLLRAPTAWRVLVPAASTADDATLLSDARKDQVFAGLLRSGTRVETRHRTIYRVHQRVARRYRAGRIILAGDAAHLNNPLGGFGMNAALHDIRNLVGKLADILCDGADPDARLDLYERQRRTVMQEFIQAQSMRNKRAMEMSPEDSLDSQESELRQAAADPVRRREYLLRQSMYRSVEREQEIA